MAHGIGEAAVRIARSRRWHPHRQAGGALALSLDKFCRPGPSFPAAVASSARRLDCFERDCLWVDPGNVCVTCGREMDGVSDANIFRDGPGPGAFPHRICDTQPDCARRGPERRRGLGSK